MVHLHINDGHEVHEPQHAEQDEAEHGESLHGEIQQSHAGAGGCRAGGGSQAGERRPHHRPRSRSRRTSGAWRSGARLGSGQTPGADSGGRQESFRFRSSGSGDAETQKPASAWWSCCPGHGASFRGLTVRRPADGQLTNRGRGGRHGTAGSNTGIISCQLQNKSLWCSLLRRFSCRFICVDSYRFIFNELYIYIYPVNTQFTSTCTYC